MVPEIRQAVVFAHHNVVKDAPFTRVDLVSCRNMLIYLQQPAQEKVLSRFHFALNRGGMMFLGPSESLGHLDHDFETIDKQWRIYRKYSDSRVPFDRKAPHGPKPNSSRAGAAGADALGQRGVARHSVAQLLGTYDTLLDELMPPSLLVDDRGELVHSFAGAARFLKLRDGRHGLDAFDMVDPELRMVLVGGLQRALQTDSAIVFQGVHIDDEPYKVTIRRVQSKKGQGQHVLISFDSLQGAPPRERAETEIDLRQVSREQLGALEAELSRTKENLQAATEELETSNEELQAANEELLASNEELQSTNEELQSVNEELYSVNAEYQRKIADLTELANDMDNLLSSTDIGTIFLDRQLKIRKFTPQIAETFNLLPDDVGRPIETFTYAVEHPELNEDLKRVLATGERVERELRDRHNRAFFLRILPYRAKGAVDGVVITLIDVSGLKAAEDALFHERYLLNSLLYSVPDAIYFKDARGRFIRANPAMAERLGLSDPRQAVGKTGFELPRHEAALAVHRQDEEVLRTGVAQHYELEKRELADGSAEWDLVSRLPLTDSSANIVGVIGIFRGVTEQKRAEEKIQDAVRRRDEFLAMLSHELRNPLGAIVSATALLKDASAKPPQQVKVLQIVERQAQQMARLLDDLLEASRVTQDKIELRRSVLDLRAVVRDAADAVRGLMETRGLDFSVDVDPEPLYVDGDAARLQQINVNLLSNAAKYTPRGGHVALVAKRLRQRGENQRLRRRARHSEGDAGERVRALRAIEAHLGPRRRRTGRRADIGSRPGDEARWARARPQRWREQRQRVHGAPAARRCAGRQGARSPRGSHGAAEGREDRRRRGQRRQSRRPVHAADARWIRLPVVRQRLCRAGTDRRGQASGRDRRHWVAWNRRPRAGAAYPQKLDPSAYLPGRAHRVRPGR